jgi:uncharacterized protein
MIRLVHRVVSGPGGERLPLMIARARAPGPTVFVSANLHGDEVSTMAIVHELSRLAPSRLLRGALWMMPSLNPAGLRAATRMVPGDPLDPNRAFPGRARGSETRRLAAAIWAIIVESKADLVLDLHTDARSAIPYAVLDRVLRGDQLLRRRCEAAGLACGLTLLREYPTERYQAYSLDQSLTGAVVNTLGVAALTIELGPRRDIDPVAVEQGVSSVLSVLAGQDMVDAPSWVHPARRDDGPWRRETGPRVAKPGLLVPMAPAGVDLPVGRLLAEVREPSGRLLEQAHTTAPCFVVAFPDRAWIEAGAATATLAVLEE